MRLYAETTYLMKLSCMSCALRNCKKCCFEIFYAYKNQGLANVVFQDPVVVADHQVAVMLVQQQWPLVKLPVVMAWVVERVQAHQLVVQERQVPILVEVPAVEPQGLYPAQLRSSVHCAKNGSRIHILSNVPPSLITSSASPVLGIVSRGRGLDQRSVVSAVT